MSLQFSISGGVIFGRNLHQFSVRPFEFTDRPGILETPFHSAVLGVEFKSTRSEPWIDPGLSPHEVSPFV